MAFRDAPLHFGKTVSGRFASTGIKFGQVTRIDFMALLDILVYPDKRLRQVASPVIEFDDELKALVKDMAETMYEAPGIGLAAIQVNVPKRVVVMDLSEQKMNSKCLSIRRSHRLREKPNLRKAACLFPATLQWLNE